MRFGENFEVNTQPTLEVLKEQENLPKHVLLARVLRQELKDKVAKEGEPPLPEKFSGCEDFFERSKSTINKLWEENSRRKN